jgi:enoyl-CoA hydratase/carnithine racemase
LYLLGERFDAARAAELGLVTRVVPDRDLLATAAETARKLAAKPSGALRDSKRLLKQGSLDQVKAAIKLEMQSFSEHVRSADAKEALSAFLEKRPPNFNKAKAPVAAE